MSQGPPQPAGASASQLADAIAQTASPTAGGAAGIPASSNGYGTIVSTQPGSPFNTVTVTIGGATTPTPGVRYYVGYSPNVGDNVVLERVGSDVVVSGALSSATGANGGPTFVGALLSSIVAISDPAWLLCDGSSFSGTTYPALAAALGGTTLPDARGVALMGAGVNGIVLGTRDSTGHLIAHTHTGAAHTHTGAAHTHSHSHQSSLGGGFAAVGSAYAAVVGTGLQTAASTDTDATSTTPGAGGSTTPGAGGSTGTGTANVPPNLGVNVYIRAL